MTEKKYKQRIIPEVTIPVEWKALRAAELRHVVFDYLVDHFNNMEVTNEHVHILIHIQKRAIRKTAFGEAMYGKKAAASLVLPILLQHAAYNNWGAPKPNDPDELLGYFNFKAKCKIDGKMETLRIAVRLYQDGKFYYNLEVNKKK